MQISVSELVQQARYLGAWFIIDGDILKVRAPSPLPNAIRNGLRTRRTKVLQHLMWERAYSKAVTALQEVESVGTVLLWDDAQKELLAVCKDDGQQKTVPPGFRLVSRSELLRMICLQRDGNPGKKEQHRRGVCHPQNE